MPACIPKQDPFMGNIEPASSSPAAPAISATWARLVSPAAMVMTAYRMRALAPQKGKQAPHSFMARAPHRILRVRPVVRPEHALRHRAQR